LCCCCCYALREDKDKLSKACAAEVFKVQMAIATDYRADPEMAALCKTDIEEHCKGIKDGGGRITACLVRCTAAAAAAATAPPAISKRACCCTMHHADSSQQGQVIW
jgi:hypothetical protein